MTEQPDEPTVPTPGPGEPHFGSGGETPHPESSQLPGENSAEGAVNPEDEGLPDWEPLTPELVEDEAIRGDFVIRWTVVGLALLLGISQIAETRTLLHLKSGEYLASHGILPPRNDVFSYTASDRPWVNLSWLFDLLMAGVNAATGGIGLSLIQGAVVGLSFGLLAHSLRPNIRTWWGSICAVLALLVCYSQFTIQPQLATLLGLSFVLWTLVSSEEPGKSQQLWRLVPAIWIWAQCDPRAWFGWFLLVLWSVGRRLMPAGPADREASPIGRVAVISFLVVIVNPFLWEAWLAPLRMYATDYPAMRAAYLRPTSIDLGFYPIWDQRLWETLNHRTLAALFLEMATIATMILNRSRLSGSHLFAFVGFNLLSVFATREFAAASLVNCVICTLNAQVWYREKFGQVYSVDWRELLFSRGGRAVTVFGVFALAWLILSGRLDGPDGKRTGVGFDKHLAIAMQDYQQVKPAMLNDHPFHFSIRQGDLMIWGGLKSFVDSRVGLFYGTGEGSLLDLHDMTRSSLIGSQSADKPSIDWRTVFDKYQISAACPRLNGPIPPPDYGTLNALSSSSAFQLTELNSSTAVFVRKDAAEVAQTGYLDEHRLDLVERAFRSKPATDSSDESPRDFPKAATTYENLFSERRTMLPRGVQLAQHYGQLALLASTGTYAPRMAALYMAIRHANDGLRIEPNSAEGYRILGLAYFMLDRMEGEILDKNRQVRFSYLRYYQSVAAFQQYLTLRPDDVAIIRQLLVEYEMLGRSDVRLDLIKRLIQQTESMPQLNDQVRQELEQIREGLPSLEDAVSRMSGMVDENLAKGADRLQIATGLMQVGGLLQAIRVLEEDKVYLERNPMAKMTLAARLIEVGRVQEAAEIFESVEMIASRSGLPGWREPAAITAMVANSNMKRLSNPVIRQTYTP